MYEFLLVAAGLNMALSAAILFATAVYFALVSIMKIEDVDDLIAGLRKKILKR